MRQAVNNLQSTWSGFSFVGADEVFKVCDQPHPVKVEALLKACVKGDVDKAMGELDDLWVAGYSAVDIVVTLFRVTKGMDSMNEFIKLEFIRVSLEALSPRSLALFLAPRLTHTVPSGRSSLPALAGDRFHAYARPRGRLDHRPTRRVDRAPVQDQHEARTVRAAETLNLPSLARGFRPTTASHAPLSY